MKTMKCNQLGGACEESFSAETFEEMAELCKTHCMEMFQKGDAAHLKAAEEMKARGQEGMMEWFQNKKKEFEALPNDQ